MISGFVFRNIQEINLLYERETSFYNEFLEKGIEFTQKYLNSYNKLQKFLAHNFLSKDSPKYRGAERALENMLQKV